MKFIPYAVIAALLVVATVLRRRRRAAGLDTTPPLIRWLKRLTAGRRTGRRTRRRTRALLGDTGQVAAREIRERLRGRLFKVITLVLLAVVAAAVVIPTLHSSGTTRQTVGIVGTLSPALRQTVVRTAARYGVTLQLVDEPSLAAARADVRAGTVGLAIDHDSSLYVKTSGVTTGATSGAEAVRAVATVLGLQHAFQGAGLSPRQEAAVAGARPLPVHSVVPSAKKSTARSTALIGVIMVFIVLSQYNTWTLMGVMEEKSSRVVEVLLSAIRPIQLLAGKVIGIGLLALLQAGLVVGFALALGDAVGSDLLKGSAPWVVAATLVWLVLGYAFYCWVYAAAGSMAERQDQIQSLALPLSVPMIVGYVVALVGASSANPSLLVQVFAYLPPTAPFAMPILVADGHVAWWGFALSIVVSVVATVGVARLAAAVYRRAVLRTGGRVRLRELLASAR